ncbi:MAG: M20 metallopeptidase family protein [Peptostreptococcaceae bacterium]
MGDTGKLFKKVKVLSEKYLEEVIEIRRDIHKNPELSFNEYRTSELVANKLEELGIDVIRNVGKTGVVGILKGKKEGKVVALRADMDALPLNEDTELSFKSINNGIMHACGHDVHSANLLGVAMILSEMKEDIKGSIKFIFQPAEENGGGGRFMVEENTLENPQVDAVFALHVHPIPLKTIVYKYGTMSSASDSFKIKVKGKKAHSSTPNLGVDAILIAATIITSLQSVIFRNIDPLETSTYTIGMINGGNAPNIIPDEVEMVGSCRNLNDKVREEMLGKIESISKGIAQSMGGDCEFILKPGYPSVINDKKMTNLVKKVSEELVGKEKVIELETPLMGSEDFSFFLQKIPGSFFVIGSGESESLHHSKFEVDEDVFKTSLELMSRIAIKYLEEN